MTSAFEGKLPVGRSLVQNQDTVGFVRITEGEIGHISKGVPGGADPDRAGFDDHRRVDNIVPLGLAIHGSEAIGGRVDGDGAIAGTAAARPIRLSFVVQHQVPQGHALAPALQRSQDNVAEILLELGAEALSVIPGSDGRFREPDSLIRGRLVDLVQFSDVAPIVVPGGARRILGGFRIRIALKLSSETNHTEAHWPFNS